MAIDTKLNDRIEAVLYAMGVENSGAVAQAVADEYAECLQDARGELTLAHALIRTDSERNLANAHKRIEHALDALGGPRPVPKLYDGPVRKP